MVSGEVDNHHSRLNEKLFFGIMIFIPTYSLLCLLVFFYFRDEYPRLYKRNTMMLLLFLSGIILLLYPYCWRFYEGIMHFNCRYFDLSVGCGYLFILLSLFARLISLLLKTKFNKALLEFNFKALQNGNFLQHVGVGGNVFISNSYEQVYHEKSTICNYIFNIKLCSTRNPTIPTQLQLPCYLSSHRFINTICILLLVLLVGVIVGSVQLTSRANSNETGCPTDTTISIVMSLFVIAFCIVLCIYRRLPDGLGIKSELNVVGNSLMLFVVVISILNYFHDPEEKDGLFAWSLLIWIEVIFVLTISFPYQVYLAKKETSYQVIFEQISMQDVLDDPFGSKALALYSATVLCCENILFLIDVNEFVSLADTIPNYQTLKVAQRIFDKFISRTGGPTLNLNTTLIEETQAVIEGQLVDSTLFDEIVEYVMRSMDDNFFEKFKGSIYFDAFRGILTAKDFES